MPVKLFITIDVEEDAWGAYHIKDPTVDNVSRIPILQALFDRFGAVPTYLINYAVAGNERARNVLKKIHDAGRCEIGTHCHPWNTPPFEEEINNANTMLCNLPYDLIYRKVKTVHHQIIDSLGLVPVCFRAGRWGFGPNVARCLSELGYKIDSSVTPFCDMSDESGPDFSNAPTLPHYFTKDGFASGGREGTLLEVPVSIGLLQRGSETGARFRKWVLRARSRGHVLGILDRLQLVNLRWLSPEMASGSDMIRLARACIGTGHSFLNMCFHSASLLPGSGPFVRNEKDLQKLMNDIEVFLEFSSKNGIVFSPLKGALEGLESSGQGANANIEAADHQ